MKKVSKVIDRVVRNNAVGIIYNFPKDEEIELLYSSEKQKKKHLVVNADVAYQGKQFLGAVKKELKTRAVSMHTLPLILNGRIVTIINSDFINHGYSKVFDEFKRFKMPLLLLLNKDFNMERIRKFSGYQHCMVIEYDYSKL